MGMHTTWAIAIGLSSAALSACVTTPSKDVKINPTVRQDDDYEGAYDKATESRDIIVDFETRYTVAATYLSPEFRAAFARRYEKIYKDPQPVLEEATDKAGFFVVIFSPSYNGYDLADQQLWSIFLEAKDQKLKPSIIRTLSQKERWQPFFPAVNQWSKEYLVLFDTPSVTPNSPDMVAKNPLKLSFANSDAHVDLAW